MQTTLVQPAGMERFYAAVNAQGVKAREKAAIQLATPGTAQAKPAGDAEARAELRKFIDLAGPIDGPKWFAEGITLADAKDRRIRQLTAENAALDLKLKAVGGSRNLAFTTGSRNLATVAAAIERDKGRLCGVK